MISRPLAAAGMGLAVLLTVALFLNGSGGPGLVPPWDKAAHFGYFFLLTAALWLGFGGRHPRRVLVLVILVGAVDEWRQLYLPGRQASVGDFATDVLAVLVALGALYVLAARRA